MTHTTRALVAAILLAQGLLIGSAPAVAQPNRIVIPFPPGGAVDAVARSLSDRLKAVTDTNYIVENRPGGSMTLAAAEVKRARPDGKTLLLTNSAVFTLFPLTKRRLPYDPDKDFIPVARLGIVSIQMVVKPDSPIKDAKQYIEMLKAGEVKPLVGVPALGAGSHMAVVGLSQSIGFKIEPVGYPGGNALAVDVIGGHIPAAVDASFIPRHLAGSLRIIGVSGQKRHPSLPDIQTFHELGHDSFKEAWLGIWVPVGTPEATVRSLEQAIVGLSQDEELRQRMEQAGVLLDVQPSSVFQKALLDERKSLAPIVEASGYKEE